MCFGVDDLIKKGYFPKGSRILTIHSGGLQGRQAMKVKLKKLLNTPDVNDFGMKYGCA